MKIKAVETYTDEQDNWFIKFKEKDIKKLAKKFKRKKK